MSNWAIVNGKVLRDGVLANASLFITDGYIADSPASDAIELDAQGDYVLPGIIDIHGDAFERIIMPRTGVFFPLDVALEEADRQLVTNGITTAFHSITVSWEPGLRSLARAHAFVEALRSQRLNLHCSTLLHVRWETFALEAMDAVLDWLDDEEHPILAFNDHTTAVMEHQNSRTKLGRMAERTGMSVSEFQALVDEVWGRRSSVGAAIEKMADEGLKRGATLLSHDEPSPQIREYFRKLGAKASEFPLTTETAWAARRADEHVILGAPNVVRGGSHLGGISAGPALVDDMCTVLASDYYYPSMLNAAFHLADTGACDLAKAWAAVSKHPAEVAGLHDRGTLSLGKRADVLVVRSSNGQRPRVASAFINGRVGHRQELY